MRRTHFADDIPCGVHAGRGFVRAGAGHAEMEVFGGYSWVREHRGQRHAV